MTYSIETTKLHSPAKLIAETTLNSRNNPVTDFVDAWLSRSEDEVDYYRYLVIHEGFTVNEFAQYLSEQIKQELDEYRSYNPLVDFLVRSGLKQVDFKAIAHSYYKSINR